MRFIPTILQLFRVPSDHFQPLGSDRSASGAPAARLARHFRVIENMLRPLLVIGALLLSAVLATMASQRQLTFVLIAILALAALAVLLRWPPLGLIFTAVAGLVVPFYGPSGLNVTTVLVAVLLTLWLIGMMVHHRELRLATSRTNWPLLTFMTVALLSFGFGQFSWFSFAENSPLDAQLGGLSIALLSPVAFLLMANQVRDVRWLSRITWVFLAVAGLSFAARSVLPLFGLPTRELFQPVGSLFYTWMVGMAFGQAAFNEDLHPRWRAALVGSVLVAMYILFFLKFADKSGWIPSVICLITIVGFRSRAAGLAVVLAGVIAGFYLWPRAIVVESYSLTTRLDAWLILAQIVQVSPIWGLGFANYYWFTPLFPIRGYAVSFNSHNNYVDIVAQMGLAGLACLVWFFWEIGKLAWRLRERASTGFARGYVYGALGGLVGTSAAGMLGDWALPFVYNIGLTGFRTSVLAWLFLGGLVCLEQVEMRGKVQQ